MKNILLVEDDPFLIDIYTTKLKEAGFSVEVAESGELVFKKIKEKIPDLLILDIVLPQIDGWEVLKKIREDLELKNLKVIILSNLGQKEDIEKASKLGVTKYLVKAHYTPSEILKEIKAVLKP